MSRRSKPGRGEQALRRYRVALQHSHRQYLLLADAQALTDNAHDPAKVRRNVLEVATDYLAVGIDPNVTTICVQSALPALAELTVLYLNFVTVARLERHPNDQGRNPGARLRPRYPSGVPVLSAAQAADSTALGATVVPVRENQAPLIEQTNEIVRRINRQAGREMLPEARALIPAIGRLPGVDGRAKMSKSQGNAVLLSASDGEIRLPCNGCIPIPTTCGRATQAGWRVMSCSPTSTPSMRTAKPSGA